MTETNNTTKAVLDWDSEISREDFPMIPAGEHNFKVVSLDRAWFNGNEKLPAAPKAILLLEVDTEDGPMELRLDLILCAKLEWKLCQFFRCIGLKKEGEPLRMDWSRVVGAKGRAVFGIRSYVRKDGNKGKSADITRFLPWQEDYFPKEPDWLTDASLAPEEEFGGIF